MKRTHLKPLIGMAVALLLIAMLSATVFADTNRTGYLNENHTYDEALREGLMNRVTEFFDDKYGPDLYMGNFPNRIGYIYLTDSQAGVAIRDVSTFYRLATGTTTSLQVNYVEDYEAYMARLRVIRAEVDALIPEGASDLEIAHIIHDYIVATNAFNERAGSANTGAEIYDYSVFFASGVFEYRTAVCRGISQAYKYLLDQYDIDNAIAESGAWNHVWNLVRIDGEWYHVDCTADEEAGSDILGKVSHDYFLISTETLLERNPKKADFTVAYKDLSLVFDDATCATDKQYESNQLWSDAHTMCHYYGGHLYTVRSDNALYCDDEFYYQPAEHMSWHPFGNQYAIYTNAVVTPKITAIDNDLYMISPRNLYHVDLDTGKAEIVHSPEETVGWTDPYSGEVYPSQDQIFGLARIEGKLYITIEDDLPADKEIEERLYVPGFDVTYDDYEDPVPTTPSGLVDPKTGTLCSTVSVTDDMGKTVNVQFSGLQAGETLRVSSENEEIAKATLSGSTISVKTLLNGTSSVKVEKLSAGSVVKTYTINVTVNKNYSKTKTLELTVDGTVSDTDESGDYSKAVNTNLLDTAIATVKVTGVNTPGTPAVAGGFTKITSYANGEYVIGYESGSTKYYLKASGSTLSAVTSKDSATKFTFSGTASSFTIKSGSYYLTHGTKLALSTSTSNSAWIFDSGKIYYSKASLSRTYKYYLRYSNKSFTVSNSTSSLAGAFINQEGSPAIPGEVYTKVEATGVSGGKTYVIVGDTLYTINVARPVGSQVITVHTVDDKGVQIAKDYTVSGMEGETYNIQPTFIYGYLAPKAIVGNYTAESSKEVTLVYTLNTDKTALKAAIDNAVSGDLYSEVTYKNYSDAIAAGKTVLNQERATQTQADDALDAINAAKGKLAKKTFTVTVNFVDNFGAKVADFQSVTGEIGTSYTVTPKTITGYLTPAAVSGTFTENKSVNAVYTLNTDKSKLVSELDNVVSGDLYTEASYKTYTDAIAAGKTFNDNAKATQTQVDAAVKAITEAKAKLVKKTFTVTIAYKDDAGVTIADSTSISGEINTSYTITPKTISGYKAPASVSGTYTANTTVTLVYTLTTDKTALQKELANMVAQGDYTADSYKVYTDAIAAGQTVNNNARVTQAQVDAAVKTITDAKAALKVASKVSFVKDTDGINSGAEYVIAYNGKALAVVNGSITYVNVTEANGGLSSVDDSAVWVLTKAGSSTYYLQNKATGKYLTTATSGSLFSRTYALSLTTSKTTWTATKNSSYMRFSKSSRYINCNGSFGLTTSKSSYTDMTLYVKQ